MQKRTILNLLSATALLCAMPAAYCQTISTVAGNGTTSTTAGVGDNGPATNAEFGQAPGVAVDPSGNLYVCDWGNSQIRKVSTAGIITRFAGVGDYGYGGDGGPATAAYLWAPVAITLDASGNVYWAEGGSGVIRKVNTAGIITTVAGTTDGGAPLGDGGPATAANLFGPTSLAIDGAGNIFVGCYSNYRVRKVTPAGVISTVAGNGVYGFSGDGGQATAAAFRQISGVAVDGAGNLYISDAANNVIRKVNTSGVVNTIAGTTAAGFSGDGGPAATARLYYPMALQFDSHGNLFFSDALNERVRVINTAGIISTVAGSGLRGYAGDGGPAIDCKFFSPQGLAFDASGNLYIGDDSNSVVRKVTPDISLAATTIVGVHDNISIFPNPSQGAFTVTMSGVNESDACTVSVADLTGRVLFTAAAPAQSGTVNYTVSLPASAPSGIYLLQLNCGNFSETRKIAVIR